MLYTLAVDGVVLDKQRSKVMTAILIILAIVTVVGFVYNQRKDKGQDSPATTSKPFFPCVVEGNVDMPPMSDVIAAAVRDVKDAGLWVDGMTDQQAMDLCSQPVPPNTFGGGGAYGGRYLTGSFHFEIDANGQQIHEKSWIKLFSDEKYPVTGGITGDGTIAMGSIGGTDIRGTVVNGKSEGRVMHGDGKTWIYGVLNGTYTKL